MAAVGVHPPTFCGLREPHVAGDLGQRPSLRFFGRRDLLAARQRLDPRVGPLWAGLPPACAGLLLSSCAKSFHPACRSFPSGRCRSSRPSGCCSPLRCPSAAALLCAVTGAALPRPKSYRLITTTKLQSMSDSSQLQSSNLAKQYATSEPNSEAVTNANALKRSLWLSKNN